MGFVLLAIILVGVAVASFVFYKKSKEMERSQASGQLGGGGFGNNQLGTDSGGSNLMNLSLNDIVSYYDRDYIVEGRLDYREDGWHWIAYMLQDGDAIRWLSVEQDDGLEVSLWREIDDAPISQRMNGRPPETIEYRGINFRLIEYGSAQVTQQGRTGRRSGMSCDYFDYEGPQGEMFAIERWGNELEFSIGEEVEPYELDILPGDNVSY
jgi:hypothetical protein